MSGAMDCCVVIGRSGAGKTTSCDMIEDVVGYCVVQASRIVRSLTAQYVLPDHYSVGQRALHVLNREGRDAVSRAIEVEYCGFAGLVIDGFRTHEELQHVRRNAHPIVIAIEADFEVRLRRAQLRDNGLTRDDFMVEENLQHEMGLLSTPLAEAADAVVENYGRLDDLYDRLKLLLTDAIIRDVPRANPLSESSTS